MIDLDQQDQSTTVEDNALQEPLPNAVTGERLINHRLLAALNDAALCEMQHRLLDSEENERQRLAQELHDGPLQELHSLDFKLVALARGVADEQQQVQLTEMRSTLRHLARHLRTICQDLRPPALTPFGVSVVIRSYAEAFQLQHPELTVTLDLEDDGQRLSERTRLAFYRIFQQGMRNVAQHAEATQVLISLRLDEHNATMCIRDDGQGFHAPDDLLPMVEQGKYGLLGCVERAGAIGGHVTIHSEPGCGVQLQVVAPIA
jgi:signal transduction histidine kinase